MNKITEKVFITLGKVMICTVGVPVALVGMAADHFRNKKNPRKMEVKETKVNIKNCGEKEQKWIRSLYQAKNGQA